MGKGLLAKEVVGIVVFCDVALFILREVIGWHGRIIGDSK